MTTPVTAPETLHTEHGELLREPSAYRATDHFRYRYNHREDPPVTDEVIETCIREGDIVAGDRVVGPNCFGFETEVNGVQWRVVVQAVAEGPPHLAVTAFSPELHDRDEEDAAPV